MTAAFPQSWRAYVRLIPLVAILYLSQLVVEGVLVSEYLGIIERVLLAALTAVIWFLLWLIAMYLCDIEIRSETPPTLRFFLRKIDLMIFVENLWLTIRTALTGALLCFPLIIPGIVYLVNRALSPFVLNLQGTTVSEALRESKRLMTAERWYALHGPQIRITGIFISFFLLAFAISFSGLLVVGGLTLLGLFSTEIAVTELISGAVAKSIVLLFGIVLQSWLCVYEAAVLTAFFRDLQIRYPRQGRENASPK